MIAKDLSKYATSNWNCYITSITEASKSDKGNSLVESDIELTLLRSLETDIPDIPERFAFLVFRSDDRSDTACRLPTKE